MQLPQLIRGARRGKEGQGGAKLDLPPSNLIPVTGMSTRAILVSTFFIRDNSYVGILRDIGFINLDKKICSFNQIRDGCKQITLNNNLLLGEGVGAGKGLQQT